MSAPVPSVFRRVKALSQTCFVENSYASVVRYIETKEELHMMVPENVR